MGSWVSSCKESPENERSWPSLGHPKLRRPRRQRFAWSPVDGCFLFELSSYIITYPLVNKHSYGKSPFSMGKSTYMAIFNSNVKLPEGNVIL